MVLDTLPPRPSTSRLKTAVTGPVLWLVRHGESTWNALGLAQGQSDQPRLTRRGALQARYAANQLRSLPIGAVYTSDLRRAVATAAPLAAALRLDVTRDPRLRERSLGLLEGTPSVDVPAALSGVAGDRVIDPTPARRTASRCATCTGASSASPTTCWRPASPDGPGRSRSSPTAARCGR
jgi:Histidine phosphatase superfamily (branch 1)